MANCPGCGSRINIFRQNITLMHNQAYHADCLSRLATKSLIITLGKDEYHELPKAANREEHTKEKRKLWLLSSVLDTYRQTRVSNVRV